MRYSRHLVALRTFGLAFAVVLTPALMQAENGCESGITTLEELSFEVAGDEMIVNFDPEHGAYEARLPEGAESVTVTAVATEEDAEVMYVLRADCVRLAEGDLPEGGGEFTLDEMLDGHSELKIFVKQWSQMNHYSIHIIGPNACL